MRYQRTVIILLLFFACITAVRLAVVHAQKPIDHPYAEQGVLDLRGWTLPPDRSITPYGEWTFYPSRLVEPASAADDDEARTLLQVPGEWGSAFQDESEGRFRYGTYRLRILPGDGMTGVLKLRFTEIGNAAAVYVNGSLAAESGRPSDTPDSHIAHRVPLEATVDAHGGPIDVVVHVSSHSGVGGITKTVRFGTVEAVDRHTALSVGLQLFLGIVLLVHGVYALLLYMLGPANRGLLYFSLLIASAIVCVLGVDDRLLFQWLPMPHEWAVRVVLLSYISVSALIPLGLQHMLGESGNARAASWFAYYCAADALFVLLAPSWITLTQQRIILTPPLVLMVIVAFTILRPAVRKREDTIFLLLSCTSLGANILWIVLGRRLVPYDLMHYPFDLAVTLFAFAALWVKRFFRSVEQSGELARQLQLANARKDEFLVSTSHELRNPLHGILNIAQSVLEEPDPAKVAPEAVRRKLNVQVAVARRMSLMLDDLLDAARLRDNLIRLRTATVDVQAAASAAAEIIRYMLAGKPVGIRIAIDPSLPAVRADEHRLIQILFNLLHNAVKFTPEGQITVEAERSDGAAVIRVRDSGIGMDEETLRRVFLPYEQGSADTAAAYGGFGLGLSVCKQLVELHGGTIGAVSVPGEGTVFTFTLPLAEEDEQPEAQACMKDDAGGGRRRSTQKRTRSRPPRSTRRRTQLRLRKPPRHPTCPLPQQHRHS